MKTSSIPIVIAAVVLLLTSCRDNDSRMLTIINEDGTCSREMSFHPDATSALTPQNEPIQNDCMHFGFDWERSWSVVGDSVRHPAPMTEAQWDSLRLVFPNQPISTKILMHAKRNFHNVSEMSDSLTRVVNDLFKATASFEKHFKWFYTDYVYQETLAITDIERYFPVPLNRFVSADTASYWFTGQPNLAEGLTGAEQKELLDEIEPNISRWFNACSMSYVCDFIANVHYDEVKNPPVTKEQFLVLKDSIVMSPAVRNMDLFGSINQISKILEDFFHSNAYTPLFNDTARWENRLENKYRGYQYLVMMAPALDYVMPGKVIDGGDGKVEGNVIHYRFSGERLIPHPYVISITSRVTNVWAFIVTFLIILIALSSLLFRRKAKA